MLEQVTHRDLLRGNRVGDPTGGQVALHGRIQLLPARLDQMHDRERGERLTRGGQHEGRLRRDLPSSLVSHAIAAQVHDLVAPQASVELLALQSIP